MKKLILSFVTLFMLFSLVSCKEPIKENDISISNMTLKEEGTYYTYIEGNTIDLTKYVSCDDDYQIECDGHSYNASVITSFTFDNNYMTIYVNNSKTSYQLDFYKKTNVSIKYIFPNDYQITKEVLVGSLISLEQINEINEYANLLGYTWNNYVDYECNNETFTNVLLTDLTTLGDIVIRPILTPCNNIITIDGKEYQILTGDIINIQVEEKAGYDFIGFKNNLNNGDKYYKTFGNSFNTIYQAKNYYITLEYFNNSMQIEQTFNEEIILDALDVDGYTFDGWYYNDELFTSKVYNIASDITLIGKFTPKTYTLSFTNIDNPYEVSVTYNESFTLPTLSKDGFIFIGWKYNDQIFNEGIWTYLFDIELSPIFEEVKKDVTLNLEAFGGVVNNIASVDSNDVIILPTPIKEGYKFVGWYSDLCLEEEVKNIKLSEYNNQMLYAKYSYDSLDLIGEITVTRINEHASSYDELAMFDSSKSGFTSKYWHKVAISKIQDGYVVSSIAINGESLSSLGEYDYVVLAYSDYPNYSSFVNLGYDVGTKVVFSVNPNNLNSGNYPVQISFVKPNIDEDIDALRDELSLLYDGIDYVSSDLDLVTNVLNYPITWFSSNRDAISSTGKYTKPYVTREVTLEAYVSDTFIYSFSFKVSGEKETSDALSTGYIYTPYDITQNAMNTLDIIYTAFLEIDANGNWTNYERMKSNLNYYILPKAKISGTKVVVSVNQKSSGNFSNVAKSAELRSKLASSILDFIIEFDLDGVDIDWETPSSSEAQNFTLLMKDIYEKVKGYDSTLLVTAAIGGGMWAPPKYDLPNSKQYIDYINLMTYSMAQSNGYYQNSLYKSTKGATLVSCSIEESIEIYNDLGVENNKILLGIPFYTTVQTSSGGPGSKTGEGNSVWYDVMLEKYPLSDTMKEYFDKECGVPYRYDSVNKIFISYDNEQSIKIKCDYINTLGLAGIMYWQYGQDVDDMLTNAIDQYINK